MFGVSFAELLVIMTVALLVFGPEKLPEIASQLGKWSMHLKRASDGFRRELYNSVYTPAKDEANLITNDLLSARNAMPKIPPKLDINQILGSEPEADDTIPETPESETKEKTNK